MWQRFTERARRAVFYAQEEAQKLGESYVTPEILLLGLLREPESVAGKALLSIGIDLQKIRDALLQGRSEGNSRPSQDMSLTPSAKLVIDMAYDTARSLHHNHISTGHLLSGVIREEKNEGARILGNLGVTFELLKGELVKYSEEADAGGSTANDGGRTISPNQPGTEAMASIMIQRFMDPGHLLLGVVKHGDNIAAKALANLGVDYDRLSAEIASLRSQDPFS